MTRFSYSEYIGLFRSSAAKRNALLPKIATGRSENSDEGASEPVSPIILAVRKGDVSALAGLASEGDGGDWTALHEAARLGHTRCLQVLLAAPGVCVDKRTLEEQTPLLLAARGGHVECVRCLIQAGSDPDIGNKNKETPLYKACERESVSLVRLLLASGAAVNQRCHRGWTALHEAARRDKPNLCETLLQAGACVDARDADDVTPLIAAARLGRNSALSLLIKKGASLNIQACNGNSALSEACRHGHHHTVTLLLQHHANANKTTEAGLLPLHIASQHGHVDIVSLLLPVSSRSMIRQSGISPLHLAAEQDHQEALRLLLHSGFQVNHPLSPERSAAFHDKRATPLYFAIAAGNTGAAALLLRAGADPCTDPLSPLFLAVHQGSLGTAALLLDHGAHVNASLPDRPTTFPAALLYTHQLHMLRLLLDRGCDAQACLTCDGSHADAAPETQSPDKGRRPEMKFCEWIWSSCWKHSAALLLDVLLDYVGNVQLCSRISELLVESGLDWTSVQQKTGGRAFFTVRQSLSRCDLTRVFTASPRPLTHLCRLNIRKQLGSRRLLLVHTLPLPQRMLGYLRTGSRGGFWESEEQTTGL